MTMHLLNADLHCHSNVSDGTLTPEQLAALVRQDLQRHEALARRSGAGLD